MATKNGSPSTRPGSGGEASIPRDAANGHRPPEVKGELPEPGEIVTESSHSQESPLDFSVKRKSLGAFHESFTDDSQASSSAGSPPLQTSGSRRLGGSPAAFEQPSRYSFSEKAGSSSPSDFHGLDLGQSSKTRDSEHPYLPSVLGNYPPGMLPTNGSKMAFPSLGHILDPRRGHGGSTKTTRPFKAYPREALSMPVGGMYMHGLFPMAGIEPSMFQNVSISTEELMTIYKQQLQLVRERDKHITAMARSSSMLNGASPRTTSGGSTSSNSSGGHSTTAAPGSKPRSMSPPGSKQQQQQHHDDHELQQQEQEHHQGGSQAPRSPSPETVPASEALVHPSPLTSQRPMPPPLTPTTPSTPTTPTSKGTPPLTSPFAEIGKGSPSMVPTASSANATLVSSTSCTSNSRKRPRILPEEQKDEAYWERRRKNNEAAKRSRDARRAKEDEIAIRAALLEQENLKLRVEVAALKTETARLRCMLYNS